MDEAHAADFERPLTAPELARRAGVSASTIWNWTRRNPPLKTTPTGPGTVGFTWADLMEFCQACPDLRGARRILDQMRAARDADAGTRMGSAPVDIESALAMARAMRAAADSNLDAALIAARQAEAAAKAHREQLERLKATFNAYDSALSAMTAPATPHG